MSRDKDVDSKAATAASDRTLFVNVVGVVASDGKMRKTSKRRKRKRKKQKRGGFSAGLEGQLGKGGHDLLFRKVSRLLLSQRAASLLCQKRKRRRGSAPLCPQIRVPVFFQRPGGG